MTSFKTSEITGTKIHLAQSVVFVFIILNCEQCFYRQALLHANLGTVKH